MAGESAQEVLLRTLVMNVSASAQLLQLDAAPSFPGSSVPAAVPVSDTARVSTLQSPLKITTQESLRHCTTAAKETTCCCCRCAGFAMNVGIDLLGNRLVFAGNEGGCIACHIASACSDWNNWTL